MYSRSSERIRSLIGAQVVFNNQNSTLNCQIRNISAGGARLAVSANVTLPDEFDLLVPAKGRTFRCKLRWRTGEAAGVEFLNLQTAPGTAAQSAPAAQSVEKVKELESENEELKRQLRALMSRVESLEGHDQSSRLARDSA